MTSTDPAAAGPLRFARPAGPVSLLSLVLIVIGGAGVVVGFVGFLRQYPPAADAMATGVLNAAWRAVALLVLEIGPAEDGLDDPLVVVARVMAPAATIGFVYEFLFAVLRRGLAAARLRLTSDHHVLVGVSRYARALIETLPGKIAWIGEAEDGLDAGARRGVFPVSAGSGVDARAVERAGVRRAAGVFIFGESDTANLAALRLIHDAAEASRATPLDVVVRVGQRTLAERLDRDDEFGRLGGARPGRLNVLAFDPDAVGARQLLQRHPLVDLAMLHGHRRVHLVVVGWSPFALAVIDQLARQSPHPHLAAPRVDVLAPDAATIAARLVAERPAFTVAGSDGAASPPAIPIVDVTCHDLDPETGVPSIAAIERVEPGPAPTVTAVLVAVPDEGEAASVALALRERCTLAGRWRGPLFVHLPDRTAVTDLLRRRADASRLADRIVRAGALEEICRADDLFARERAARRIHEAYLRTADPSEGGPARVPWPELAQSYRAANRRAADHLRVKLLGAGYHVSPPADGTAASTLVLAPDDEGLLEPSTLEALADLEHQSWSIDRRLDGWRPGRERDDARRVHPAVDRPYRDLPPGVQEYDRAQIRALDAMLRGGEGEVTVRRELRIGLLGHRVIRAAERDAIRAGVRGRVEALLSGRPRPFVSLLTPLAPGADLILAEAVAGVLADQRVPHRIVAVETLRRELVVGDFLPLAGEDDCWSLGARPGERPTAAAIDDYTAALLARTPGSVVVDLTPLGASLDWWTPERRVEAYRRANAYLVRHCDELVAFADLTRAGGPGGTAEALRWAADPAAMPGELASSSRPLPAPPRVHLLAGTV